MMHLQVLTTGLCAFQDGPPKSLTMATAAVRVLPVRRCAKYLTAITFYEMRDLVTLCFTWEDTRSGA